MILLIRHAAHGELGKVLSGRSQGGPLSAEGRAQAATLAARLARTPLDLLHTSPVARARETADAIAAMHPDARIETAPALNELDFGDWSGRAFEELAVEPAWQNWNNKRASATIPDGESMVEARDRAWDHVARTAASHPGQVVAMVTHCDIIRALIAHVLGLSLDHLLRFDVDPASVSRIAIGDWGAKVISLNERCDA
jgi:ribonuclease H / adenosylcobalamin/alpha-ribazole phosphatase